MESSEQSLFLADDSHVNSDANFCSLQSGVQMQFEHERPVMHEPSTLEGYALHGSGVNTADQQVNLAGDIAHDDNSVVENGGRPGSSGLDFNNRCMVSSDEAGHTIEAKAIDSTVKVGVCIGTIVDVNERRNEGSRAHMVQTAASSNKPGTRIDYGESVAIEDFGGEFEDGLGMEEFSHPSVSVFADGKENKLDGVNAASVETGMNDESDQIPAAETQHDADDAGPEEQPDIPDSLDKVLQKSPINEASVEYEDEPPELEREVVSEAGKSEQCNGDTEKTSKLPLRWSRRQSETVSGRQHECDMEQLPAPNAELNVNSRPRRSVNRKSVFELLHVDYRHVGGPKKVVTHRASEDEVNHDRSPAKKRRSSRKETKLSRQHASDNTEKSVKPKRSLPIRGDLLDDIDYQIDALKKKVIGYKPDDFLDDGVEPEATKDSEEKEKKSTLDADRSSLKESIFAEKDDMAARSFLSTFAAETTEALSSSKQGGDASSELGALISENQELRSRIKALEQSKSLIKKFNIDFHGRKFSRIRSPAVGSPDQQKTPGKIRGTVDKTPATEQKAPVETSESVLSRIALLNRHEHKLRELSAELDERATSVKIAEGALRRKERKLLDFEKTLEHRERVLSRHEQSILKRELVLGSASLGEAEDGEDRQSFVAEIQRRLEQRRLELDRRQTALYLERTRLEAREQKVNQSEAIPRTADESSSGMDENEVENEDTADHSSSRPSKRLTSDGKQKRKSSVSQSIRSKYLSPKKQKVLVGFLSFDFFLW